MGLICINLIDFVLGLINPNALQNIPKTFLFKCKVVDLTMLNNLAMIMRTNSKVLHCICNFP